MPHSLAPLVPALLAWYRATKRPLPWRTDPSPYRVWVSEIMLQQTRIEAVLPRFEAFFAAFPTIGDLAAAPEDRLLKLWEGLGYYSRARNLQKTARLLTEQYDGRLPETAAELETLPGIGPYVAGAVASIAFSQPVAAVDGNVLRVLARLTGDARDIGTPAAKRYFTELAGQLLPADAPGAFNQALMELGERVCLPNGAPCRGECPCQEGCTAQKTGTQLLLPVRSPKKPRRREKLDVFVFACQGRVALEKRPENGLLSGLWQFPNAPAGTRGADAWALSVIQTAPLPPTRHIFTHIQWEMHNVFVTVARPDGPFQWVTPAQLQARYALPSAFRDCWKAAQKKLQQEET